MTDKFSQRQNDLWAIASRSSNEYRSKHFIQISHVHEWHTRLTETGYIDYRNPHQYQVKWHKSVNCHVFKLNV